MQWISVKDRLPNDDEQPCLVKCPDNDWAITSAWYEYDIEDCNGNPYTGFILYWPYESSYGGTEDIYLTNITHWALPEPPKQ